MCVSNITIMIIIRIALIIIPVALYETTNNKNMLTRNGVPTMTQTHNMKQIANTKNVSQINAHNTATTDTNQTTPMKNNTPQMHANKTKTLSA